MKTISAHITGFYRSTFHAYTTEVNVDGHHWRLGLRYSKFHEFYDQLMLTEKEFAAEFPPKGTLFFTPKPEERQAQLEVFLQEVIEFYVAKGYPQHMEDLLSDLLKIPRHLKSDREDDDASTSTESIPEEPVQEPAVRAEAVMKEVAPKEDEEKTPVVSESIVESKQELKVSVEAVREVKETKEVHFATAMVSETRVVEKTDADMAPTPMESAEVVTESVESAEVLTESVEKAEVVTEPTESAPKEEAPAPIAPETAEDAEQPATAEEAEVEHEAAEEEVVAEPVAQNAEDAVPEAQPVEEPAKEVEPASEEIHQEHEEEDVVVRQRFSSSWFANYFRPTSLLEFIRRRCMKKTSLVVLCVALFLPMVLARR
ncbi:hypothetical protein BBJ28_00014011 [Nothophytophthora sp. Chile5]|nr:hypothetical protein BBJ28_00014011 [Nothophytophthora sp. Chile5]